MYRFILVINIYSLRNWSGNVLYISVSRNFYKIFFCHWYLIPYSVPGFRFLIRDSYFTAAIFAIKMCISIQKNSFSVKQQLCLYCKRNQTNTCFTGICYQRNYRQHTKVRSVGSNSLLHETCKLCLVPRPHYFARPMRFVKVFEA